MYPNDPIYPPVYLGIIGGAFTTIIGFVVYGYYINRVLDLEEQMKNIAITNSSIRTESITNDYRTFTVYNLSDVKEFFGLK